MTTQKFVLEERYQVIKLKTGKPVECLVIEKDWAEYEPTLKMLADRVNGVSQPNEPVANKSSGLVLTDGRRLRKDLRVAPPTLEEVNKLLEAKVKEQKEQIDRFTLLLDNREHQIAELTAKCEQMREALEYYKDAISIDDSACECGRGTQTLDDGYKAREALKKVKSLETY